MIIFGPQTTTMPFNTHIDLDNGGLIGLWSLTETESELMALFSAANLADPAKELEHITVVKKRKQWLAARLLVKKLIPTFESITYDQFGAPYVVDHDTNISMSHSNDHIAVILHQDHEVGIDIQVEDVKLERISSKFLNEEENERYQGLKKGLPYLHLLWSAKEAVFKIHRHHMAFKKIRTQEFDWSGGEGRIVAKAQRFDGEHHHEIYFKRMAGVYMAYTCYDPD